MASGLETTDQAYEKTVEALKNYRAARGYPARDRGISAAVRFGHVVQHARLALSLTLIFSPSPSRFAPFLPPLSPPSSFQQSGSTGSQ